MKQKLESIFSKSLKHTGCWYIKLQVNPLAHTKTPADYIIVSKWYKTILVECKQIDLRKNPKNRFGFNRLTQHEELGRFDTFYGKAFICFLFLNKTLKKSHFYLVPMYEYERVIRQHKKKSFNLKDMEINFQIYKLDILKGSILDLSTWIK